MFTLVEFIIAGVCLIVLSAVITWVIRNSRKPKTEYPKTVAHDYYAVGQQVSRRKYRKLMKQKGLGKSHFGNFKPVKSLNKGGGGKS